MDFEKLPEFYKRLDSKYNVTNSDLENATYTSVESNFVYSARYARHRWFNYKEGFSPVLVDRIFNEYGLDDKAYVCDPFCGAGTTLTVAKERNMHSVGFEVNPFAAFITKVKTGNYEKNDLDELWEHLSKLKELEIKPDVDLPENEYVRRIFDQEMLISQINIRDYIFSIKTEQVRELLFFAWLCTLEECSLYRKAGNGLKKKKYAPIYGEEGPHLFAVRKIEERCEKIKEDFGPAGSNIIPEVYSASAENMTDYISQNSLDLVLFSPPYANCFDYTKIYYLELWFGEFVKSKDDQKDIRMQSIRSHCHATWPDRYTDFHLDDLNDELLPLLSEQKLWTDRIPGMLNGYFADMEHVLRQIHISLKTGGHCAIVVSNSAYAGVIIPTDIFLAEIAERIGFEVEEVEVERLIITSSQQYKKTEHIRKYLRESIVKIKKVRSL